MKTRLPVDRKPRGWSEAKWRGYLDAGAAGQKSLTNPYPHGTKAARGYGAGSDFKMRQMEQLRP